jgi:toluene monooxygenase electron transfer component
LVVLGLRDPASAFLLDALDERAAASRGALRVTVAFSHARADAALAAHFRHLSFARGLVPLVADQALGSLALRQPIHFIAGPPPMVDATVKMLVLSRKVSPRDVRYDRFA